MLTSCPIKQESTYGKYLFRRIIFVCTKKCYVAKCSKCYCQSLTPFGVGKTDLEKTHRRNDDQETAAFYVSLRFTALFNSEIFSQPVSPNCNVARSVYKVTAECAFDLGSGSR